MEKRMVADLPDNPGASAKGNTAGKAAAQIVEWETGYRASRRQYPADTNRGVNGVLRVLCHGCAGPAEAVFPM